MIKFAKDLTPQEMALIVARHEKRYSLESSIQNGPFAPTVILNDSFMAPLWQRDKAAVLEKKYRDILEELGRDAAGLSGKRIRVSSPIMRSYIAKEFAFDWYKSATLEDITRALIDYWQPGGVEI